MKEKIFFFDLFLSLSRNELFNPNKKIQKSFLKWLFYLKHFKIFLIKKKMSTDSKNTSKKYAETIKNLEEENRRMKLEYEEKISKLEKENDLLQKKLQLLEHDRNFLYQQVQEINQSNKNPSINKSEQPKGENESITNNTDNDEELPVNFKLTGNSEYVTWLKMKNYGKGLKPRMCGNSNGKKKKKKIFYFIFFNQKNFKKI